VSEHDELIDRVAAELRHPVRLGSAFDARVMAQVEQYPPHRRGSPLAAVWAWLRRPFTLRLSPLGGLSLAAAVLATVAVLRLGHVAPSRPAAETRDRPDVQFVFVAPGAVSVSVVGDFNDWNPRVTPLHAARVGVWEVSVPLAPGRHRYAFVVDGRLWRPDPAAPRAVEDDFGAPNSVVTVGG
jgi:predicted carbohydrate-binding protein with CBM48